MSKKQILLSAFTTITGVLILLLKTCPLADTGRNLDDQRVGNPERPPNSPVPMPTKASHSSANTQARQLQAQLALGVERFRGLPFRPEYGPEVFDNTKKPSNGEQEKWLRHCVLRDAYKSQRIREPAFLELYELVQSFGLKPDIAKLCDLHDVAYGLSIAIIHATDYSPELVSDARQDDLEKFLEERKSTYQQIISNLYGIEVTDKFMSALMKIQPAGGIGDPNTHIEPGERIILN